MVPFSPAGLGLPASSCLRALQPSRTLLSLAALRGQAEAATRASLAHTHRELVHRLGFTPPFAKVRQGQRVLLVSESGNVPESQVYPFFFFAGDLARARFQVREMTLRRFEARPDRIPAGAEVVVLQLWMPAEPARVSHIVDLARYRCPNAKLVFMDSLAPTDLRLAELLEGRIDVYVKKHLLRDRSAYQKPTLGDTNLTDYYARLYGIQEPERYFPVPAGFSDKLRVGPSFFTDRIMLPHFFACQEPMTHAKTIDVHARISFDGDDWYSLMRSHAKRALEAMTDLVILSEPGASRRQYLSELAAAKLCFSPFGYGEVSWRDYEAVMCGALLVKPDMSHCETAPDIFVAHETYVPIRWDYADLEEKVRYYLSHEGERLSITRSAHRLLHEYCRGGAFVAQVTSILSA